MLSPSQSEREPNAAEPAPNPILVREQLRRLLAHPLFVNSKRYPVLLAYTVEQALAGHSTSLKERTIGVEAFGREPNYDVGLDPVVRMAAAEVRKRLSQYYYDANHAGELVIELPVGSYVPLFRETVPVVEAPASTPEPPASVKATGGWRRWALITAGVLLAAAGGYQLGHVRVAPAPTNLEKFWEPITATHSRVTYCLGEPALSSDLKGTEPPGQNLDSSLNLSDVTTLARSIAPLVPKSGAFRVLGASQTGFNQLREGPFVLIGAFDNPWTMRITHDLPFGFVYENGLRKIVDRKTGGKRFWTLQWQVPDTKLAQDYAVVARIHDTVTGQPVIVLAGILGEGTEAAGEVTSNPAYLNALLEKAPKNWDHLNLAAVVGTKVIDGHPGPPAVMAVETW